MNPVKTFQCYRCNLTFSNENLALIHEDITGHKASVNKEKQN
jgi:hypothetical protein